MMKIISPCWKPSTTEPDHAASSHGSHSDGLICYTDLGHHAAGEFSMATIQANNPVEDASQIESGPLGTFIGVYDGHGGPQASQYITRNLFLNLKNFANEQQGMSRDVIRKAFAATEEGFISTVRKKWLSKPRIALVGSCCLVGVVCGDMVYIANAGDSRAVLGRCERGEREVVAVQMSTEHNVNIEAVRDELRALHPEDSKIVVLRHKVWRVKGVLQVSRSIGDAYLKDAEFNRDPLPSRFRLRRPYKKPILSAEPSILTHKLCPRDQFLIFASDGLWEHLTNQEAVEIVQDSPRNGIARRLVKIALKEAAKKKEMRYADLKNIDCEVRRHFHDDISVVVLFLDPTLINRKNYCGSVLSLRGGGASMQPDPPSRF